MAIQKLYLATFVYFLIYSFSALANDARMNLENPNEGSVVCGSTGEGGTVGLSCLFGAKISQITFASFGNPLGSCGSFSKGTCDASSSLPIVQQACIGKQNCSISASDAEFGATPCKGPKTLAVQAAC